MQRAPVASDARDHHAVTGLREYVQRIRLLQSIADHLYWDERVEMPPAAAPWRATQRAALAGQLHDLTAGDELGRRLDAAEQHGADLAEIRVIRRDHDRARTLPQGFAADHAAAVSAARAAWAHAHAADDFEAFRPHLEGVLAFARESAECFGYEREPYDAVLDTWEPGADMAFLEPLLDELSGALHPLLGARPGCPKELTLRPLDDTGRRRLEHELLVDVGFDFERGVIADSTRAFCIVLAPDDVRMTTRFHQTPWLKGLHSSLHEAGHAIYGQSFGRLGVTPALADAPGLGMDESQSRLVENFVGRSRAFAHHVFGRLRVHFPDTFRDGEAGRLYTEFNTAEHPCRRLGTDEISYNLHIIVRTEIERALVNGDMQVADLPDAWAASMERHLGQRPDRHVDGCLQDVHWSLGQWGYFPTYALGNVYCAQLLEQAAKEGFDLDRELGQTGRWDGVRSWFDDNVYAHGRAMTGRQLVEHVTGEPPAAAPLLAYLNRKFVAGADEFVVG